MISNNNKRNIYNNNNIMSNTLVLQRLQRLRRRRLDHVMLMIGILIVGCLTSTIHQVVATDTLLSLSSQQQERINITNEIDIIANVGQASTVTVGQYYIECNNITVKDNSNRMLFDTNNNNIKIVTKSQLQSSSNIL
jgi:hypothetical protein